MEENFSLDQYIGKNHVVFFFYPKDFTFVCPSELHAFQAKLGEFEERGVKVVACSTDTEESHWGWLQVPKNKGGIEGITYPIVADTSKVISEAYGVLAGDYDYDMEGKLAANASNDRLPWIVLDRQRRNSDAPSSKQFPLGSFS